MEVIKTIKLTKEEQETINMALSVIDDISDAADRDSTEIYDYLVSNAKYDNKAHSFMCEEMINIEDI